METLEPARKGPLATDPETMCPASNKNSSLGQNGGAARTQNGKIRTGLGRQGKEKVGARGRIRTKPFFEVLKQTGLSYNRLLEGFSIRSKSGTLGNVSPKLVLLEEVAQS